MYAILYYRPRVARTRRQAVGLRLYARVLCPPVHVALLIEIMYCITVIDILYINVWRRTLSISALACYISAENLLLNLSHCSYSAALPLDPAGDYPQTTCAFCSGG